MDLEAKKTVLRKMPHGVYVVGVQDGERLNAFVGTWVTQASFEPPLLVMGVRKEGTSLAMIEASQVFSLNVLATGQKSLAEKFLKPAHLGHDKLADIAFEVGVTGAPILKDALGYVECRVKAIHAGGDHSIVVGEVVEAGVFRDVDGLGLKETGWNYGG